MEVLLSPVLLANLPLPVAFTLLAATTAAFYPLY
jgi:hypothetical protein